MSLLAAPLLALLLAGELLPVGTPAPAIEARGADGHAWGQDFEGRITIVDFFATWCPHCRRSIADYERLVAKLNDKAGDRVRLVIVDVEEEPALVRAFFARRKLPGAEIVIDRSGATRRAWRVTGFPSMYVVDRKGVIRDAESGWGDDTYRFLSEMIPFLENEDAPREKGSRRRPRSERSKTRALSPDDERARQLGVEVLR